MTSSTYLATYSYVPSFNLLIHKSGSAFDGKNPIFLIFTERFSWNLALELERPYIDLSIINLFPSSSGPNSGPAIMYTFSLVFPYKKAFPTSPAQTNKSCISARRNPILTASIVTTLEKISSLGCFGALCPPATNRDFFLPSNFTSKTIWYGILLYPLGRGVPSGTTKNVL